MHLGSDEAYAWSCVLGRLDSLYATSVVVRKLVQRGAAAVAGWFVSSPIRRARAGVAGRLARRDTTL